MKSEMEVHSFGPEYGTLHKAQPYSAFTTALPEVQHSEVTAVRFGLKTVIECFQKPVR